MRDLFTKDIGWKIFSIVLAVAIWVTIRTLSGGAPRTSGPSVLSGWSEFTFTNQPVIVLSAAGDVRNYKVTPATVDVRISAGPQMLQALQANDIRVSVDVTGIESASNLTKRVEVSAPPGVVVVRVTPNEVKVVVPPN